MSYFESKVEFVVDVFQGWIENLRNNFHAEGSVLEPEVIQEALNRVIEFYGMDSVTDEEIKYYLDDDGRGTE